MKNKVKKLLKIFCATMKWGFIVFLIFIGSLFFREQRLPAELACDLVEKFAPAEYIIHFDRLSFGFLHGLHVGGLKVYERAKAQTLTPMMSASSIWIFPFAKSVRIRDLEYLRLPESYYAPGNLEKNAPVEATLPEIPKFTLELETPNILGVQPEKVVADVEFTPKRMMADRVRIDWPDRDEPMQLDGYCMVDLRRQVVEGEVLGSARQSHIRPLLVQLDVPVSLPYMDAFTDVPGKVPSRCSWKVNLVNNDFDLYLKLNPKMGKYNLVPMDKVFGDLHLFVYTRGTSLNYHHEIGPIHGIGVHGEKLSGTVTIDATNGYNKVDIEAKSTLAAAQLLKIGGFAGEYVDEAVKGDSECRLQFRFPRAMTNNYEVMDGFGHLQIKDGQVMRMKGFNGLVELMADKVPGVSYFTDSTQASCDYTIEKGVIKTDNIFIEGSVFSIKMSGEFDAVHEKLDFKVLVQFTKKDTIAGKILHPLTWPFTKLLMEFRLTGSPSEPKWKYISVVDRVLEAVK